MVSRQLLDLVCQPGTDGAWKGPRLLASRSSQLLCHGCGTLSSGRPTLHSLQPVVPVLRLTEGTTRPISASGANLELLKLKVLFNRRLNTAVQSDARSSLELQRERHSYCEGVSVFERTFAGVFQHPTNRSNRFKCKSPAGIPSDISY